MILKKEKYIIICYSKKVYKDIYIERVCDLILWVCMLVISWRVSISDMFKNVYKYGVV